jgi:hypothetical protein
MENDVTSDNKTSEVPCDAPVDSSNSVEQEAKMLIEKFSYFTTDEKTMKSLAIICVDEMITEFLRFSELNEETKKRFNELASLKAFLENRISAEKLVMRLRSNVLRHARD